MAHRVVGQFLARGTEIGGEGLAELRSAVRGSLCLPGEDGYDEARIDLERHDRSSAWRDRALRRCRRRVRAVTFAREHDLLVAVRGGGHNIAGNAVCDGGLVDRPVADALGAHRPAVGRTARVEPGATLVRRRPRGAGLRAGDTARHQLDDGRRPA